MTEELMILPENDEALQGVKPNQTVFISRHGTGFFDQFKARYDGATHVHCECTQGIRLKEAEHCDSCGPVKMNEVFMALEQVDYDSGPCFLYGGEVLFNGEDELKEYCEENKLVASELQCVTAVLTSLTEVNADMWAEDVYEGFEYSKEFRHKVREFNDYLKKIDTGTYRVGEQRLNLSKM